MDMLPTLQKKLQLDRLHDVRLDAELAVEGSQKTVLKGTGVPVPREGSPERLQQNAGEPHGGHYQDPAFTFTNVGTVVLAQRVSRARA
jgi:hypothetical protein